MHASSRSSVPGLFQLLTYIAEEIDKYMAIKSALGEEYKAIESAAEDGPEQKTTQIPENMGGLGASRQRRLLQILASFPICSASTASLLSALAATGFAFRLGLGKFALHRSLLQVADIGFMGCMTRDRNGKIVEGVDVYR
ncbi:hypothetical protein RHGRI_032664 [Rhododendron griersonianum]|uniref:Uncharacterized protein n=1 Tax=Rhododendron griersonianum TaxID=479676 RepID=A0AAV6IF14_9ERIC|nr:hypothetical protein RHGRI_032664 [Rhododendron griersonianum]